MGTPLKARQMSRVWSVCAAILESKLIARLH
uniref:Uncharacterized protein n=1 Tax=Arundo donax TaxID=35708 RepID=A0A0A9FN93_ARUDO